MLRAAVSALFASSASSSIASSVPIPPLRGSGDFGFETGIDLPLSIISSERVFGF